jgi:hypothetical protein
MNTEKIKLFICGAQKAGTTSLKQYLSEHPAVHSHVQKEFAYFYNEEEYLKGEEVAYSKYFGPFLQGKKLIAKNAGLYTNEKGLIRLAEHNAGCKIVLILRNPVERAYSAFQMEASYGHATGEFEDVIRFIDSGNRENWHYQFLIKMGEYETYVRNILKIFPKENVIVLRYEDLKSNALSVCRTLFEHLDVSTDFRPDITVRYNVTHKIRSKGYAKVLKRLMRNDNPIKRIAQKLIPARQDYKLGEFLRNANKTQLAPEAINETARRKLAGYYKPFNERLSITTGIDFSDWNT